MMQIRPGFLLRLSRSIAVGLAVVLAGGSLVSGPASADPIGTVPLDPDLIDRAWVFALSASPAGVLYDTRSRVSGAGVTTWVKPNGAAAFQVQNETTAISGSMLFARDNDGTNIT